MKKWFLIIVIIPTFLLTAAKGKSVKGFVIDKNTNKPLVGANILVKDFHVGCSADTAGWFELDISQFQDGDYFLQVLYMGYHSLEYPISIPYKYKKPLLIYLKPSLLQLDQIVVTGTRTERFLKDTPVSTRVIRAEQLRESGSSDIGQALSEITGITINENQFGAGVNTVEIQGFGSEHVQILLNGVKMIGRVNGQLDISQIPISQVERVEIVKGAASTLYGSEAMGGVINIITKKADDKLGIGMELHGGSYGRLDGAVSVSLPFGKWHSALNLSYRKYDGYDLDEGTVQEDATAFQKYHGQFTINGQLTDYLTLNMESLYYAEDQAVVSSSIFKDKINNGRKALRIEAKAKELFSEFNLKTGVEYSFYNHLFDRIVLSSGYLKKGSLSTERLAKADALFDFYVGTHQINGGFALESEKINSDRVVGGKRQAMLYNLFLQDEWPVLDWLTVLGGIRLDAHSIYGKQFSPKIAAMISPTGKSRLRLSYAAGFRAPSFKELYLDYTNISVGYHIEGNSDLEPETSRAYQADFELWNDNDYHLRIHLFYNRIKNLIDYDYLGVIEGFGTYRSANLLAAKTWGVDWDMEYFPLSWLNLSLGYSYLDSWDETTANPLTFKSKHKGQAALKFKFDNGLRISLRGQYFGKKFYWMEWDEVSNGGTKDWISDYVLFHANLSFPVLGKFRATLGGRNLSDYVNKKWGPMPGREFYIGLAYNLKNNP